MTTSSATCSASAVASTIIALMPPVSAISGTIGPFLAARVRLIACAVPVEPVKARPPSCRWAEMAAPISGPPGSSISTSAGMPAWCISLTAS